MSSVSKCDFCGSINNHEDCTIVVMYNQNAKGSKGTIKENLEACPECYRKIKELCNVEDKSGKTV